MSSSSRIAAAFARRAAAPGACALIPYVTAGYPTPATTVPVMHALVAAGADVLELGVPFSDPMADGPVIQRSSQHALEQGVGLRDVLAMVKEFRRTDDRTPVVLMGYANPVERMGQAAFAAAAQDAGLNDAQIAHIAYTAGQIDIQAADLALEKTHNKDVRAFAEDMVRDHKAVNEQALALVTKLRVTPQDNATSAALLKQATETRATLKTLEGAAFDKAYTDNEVAFHKAVDSALETTLIPSAQNPELKALLQTGLKIFQGHEQHAEHLAQSLR